MQSHALSKTSHLIAHNMKLAEISKILLILILPFLLFLSALKFTAFDSSFYQEKFLEYGVYKEVPQADSLHQSVISFLKGASNGLPPDFNEREKQHLNDVRKALNASIISLYALLSLFISLLAFSALKISEIAKAHSNHHIWLQDYANFISRVLLFGGALTLVFGAFLLFFMLSDFSAAFESFHRLFFQKGTYTFNPTKEMIVRLYPEQLFMDLGKRILKFAIIDSAGCILFGALLTLKDQRYTRTTK